jgi:alpha-aminoadipate carrier protein LysW
MPVCPACEAEIELDELDVDEGETISCPDCGIDLEVLSVTPLELALSSSEEDEKAWVET